MHALPQETGFGGDESCDSSSDPTATTVAGKEVAAIAKAEPRHPAELAEVHIHVGTYQKLVHNNFNVIHSK